jgi:hypothetical protein
VRHCSADWALSPSHRSLATCGAQERSWSGCWAPPEIGLCGGVRLCLGPPAADFTRLLCVRSASEGLPLLLFQKKDNVMEALLTAHSISYTLCCAVAPTVVGAHTQSATATTFLHPVHTGLPLPPPSIAAPPPPTRTHQVKAFLIILL